jgi:hypothetical protein
VNITGISLEQFHSAVDALNATETYAGNLRVHADAHVVSANRLTARLDVRDSRGPGARRSWSGRRGPYACWHAYRDVLTELFRINPDAVVRTSQATYRGALGFETTFPATGRRNVGSQVYPQTMPDMCDHGHNFSRVYVDRWTYDTAGEKVPDVSRPCDRKDCDGTYRATSTPHYDADGSAMVDLTCDQACGMSSVAYWTHNEEVPVAA